MSMAAPIDADRAQQTQRNEPEVAEDPGFQRRSWTIERISWVVTLLLLSAGVLGLFGSNGPLNRATAGDPDGPLHVEYARLTRHGAPTALQVTVGGPAAAEDEVRIAISRDYLASVELVEVLPEPQQVDLAPDAYIFVFSVAEGGAPLTIAFEVEPQHYWRHRGTIGLPDGEPLRITQFVYP
jgi:hypothetical protein